MTDNKPGTTPEQARLLTEINDDFEQVHVDINRTLRIKRIPVMAGFRLRDLDKYSAFLDSSPEEQANFMSTVHPDEVEFYEQLQISRIEYDIAEEKSGSITEERVARNPEQYGLKP